MKRGVLVVMALGSSASAQPRPTKVPEKSVPCAPDGAQLVAATDDAVLCWDKGCMSLDWFGGASRSAPRPASTSPWRSTAEVKDDQICLGTTCKKLGAKVAAAVAAYKADYDPRSGPMALHATTDLKAVAVGRADMWSVAADKLIRFPKPNLYRRTPGMPGIVGFSIAGELIVVHWADCAGPCAKFSITDSSGRPKAGAEGEDGGAGAFQLDAKRFVVVGDYGTFSVFDLGTGKPRGATPPLSAEPSAFSYARLDDTTIAVMYTKHESRDFQVATITAEATDPKPMVQDRMFLPKCKN